MRNATQIYNLYRIWLVKYKHQGLSNRHIGRILEVHHKTVAKWAAGIEPVKPQPCKKLSRESKRKRRQRIVAHRQGIVDSQYGYEHTFAEIAQILNLKPNEVEIIYINASRKLQIIFERKGIKLDIEQTRESMEGQF